MPVAGAASPSPSADGYFTKTEVNSKLLDKMDKQLAIDQPITFYARNAGSGQVCRITQQPVWDDGGMRLVVTAEGPITI